jgi:hypothetical protein
MPLNLPRANSSQITLVHHDLDLSADMSAAVAFLNPVYIKFEKKMT